VPSRRRYRAALPAADCRRPFAHSAHHPSPPITHRRRRQRRRAPSTQRVGHCQGASQIPSPRPRRSPSPRSIPIDDQLNVSNGRQRRPESLRAHLFHEDGGTSLLPRTSLLPLAALLAGTDIEGTWFDRTACYEAQRKGEDKTAADFATAERVSFTPLPCWTHLEPVAYRGKVADLIRKIVEDSRRNRAGRGVLGKRAILAQHPHDKPLCSDRSPAPLVHAATKAVRVMLRTAYYEFVAAFREAAMKLRRGDRFVRFPAGAFPPPMPCSPSG
jgi:hypothetical protein